MAEKFSTIEHQFVKVYDQERQRPLYLGLITGFVTSSLGIGVRANVYHLGSKVHHIVSFEYLRVIDRSIIFHGLRGLRVRHALFGEGIIAEERRPRDMLEVRLRREAGRLSEWLSLTEVVVLGPPLRVVEST